MARRGERESESVTFRSHAPLPGPAGPEVFLLQEEITPEQNKEDCTNTDQEHIRKKVYQEARETSNQRGRSNIKPTLDNAH